MDYISLKYVLFPAKGANSFGGFGINVNQILALILPKALSFLLRALLVTLSPTRLAKTYSLWNCISRTSFSILGPSRLKNRKKLIYMYTLTTSHLNKSINQHLTTTYNWYKEVGVTTNPIQIILLSYSSLTTYHHYKSLPSSSSARP